MRLAILSLGLALNLFAADPIVGTWKLNLKKSKLHTPVQSATMTVTETGSNTYLTVFDFVTAKGKEGHQEQTSIFDGNEHPVEGGASEIASPEGRTVIRKLKGKYVGQVQTQVSPDGKTLTSIQNRIDPKGNPYEDVRVYERQ